MANLWSIANMFHEVKVEIATTDSEATCLYHMLHGQVSDCFIIVRDSGTDSEYHQHTTPTPNTPTIMSIIPSRNNHTHSLSLHISFQHTFFMTHLFHTPFEQSFTHNLSHCHSHSPCPTLHIIIIIHSPPPPLPDLKLVNGVPQN